MADSPKTSAPDDAAPPAQTDEELGLIAPAVRYQTLRPRISAPPSDATKSDAFNPGALVAGKYIVQRVIGEGGIGVVVAARHVHLDQTVAIKYLQPRAVHNPSVVDRFLREARLAAQIQSEHVVRVYDVATLTDGSPYMVMEYLEGTDLGALLASGPLPIDRAIDYILQACEALAEAHAAGIVHRDLKPENLFVATRSAGKSVLKILDFGISKISAKRNSLMPEVTLASDKFGTPLYMSPEQLTSTATVDARADVWALGVVFYELLTSKLPFERESLPELCTAILHATHTPLCQARPTLPADLGPVLDRCLEKDREKRFQNVAEFAQELRPFAMPNAQSRIDHVIRVVSEGGEQVRPPTPDPAAMQLRATRDAETVPPSGREALTTGAGASWGGPAARPVGRGRWGRIALGAGLGSVALVVLLWRLLAPTTPAPNQSPPVGQVAAEQPAAPPPAVAPPAAPPATGSPAAAAAEARSSEPTQGASLTPSTADSSNVPSAIASPASAQKPRSLVPKPASTKKKPVSPAPMDTNAVLNPFD